MYIYIYVYVCIIYICIYVYICRALLHPDWRKQEQTCYVNCSCIHVHIYTYVYIYTHTHVYIYTYVYTYIYLYIYTHIYMCRALVAPGLALTRSDLLRQLLDYQVKFLTSRLYSQLIL